MRALRTAPHLLRGPLATLFTGILLPLASYTQQKSVITSNVDEVSVDIVAHDKHGRPIRDLKPDELQIFDDGHATKITGLHLVTPGESPTNSGQHAQNIRSLAFVFDSLQGDANSIALHAAEYLLKEAAEKEATEKDFYFSVWRLTNRLELAQTLSNDQPVLKRALETTLKQSAAKPLPVSSPTQPPAVGLPDTAKSFAKDLPSAAALATRIARDENVPPFVAGLLALVRQHASLPGRKTIVYFSDGQTLSSLTNQQFQSIIGAANLARVSIYSVDASGVRPAHDYYAGLGIMHGPVGSIGPSGPAVPTTGPGPAPVSGLAQTTVGLPQAGNTAGLVTSTQMRTQSHGDFTFPMKQIAEETGGSYMSETNSFFDALRRMLDDASTYYEATYAPGKIDYDGHFRPIQVQVSRPHIALQARAGYYSFAPNIGADLRPFELPLLKALAQPTRTQAIPQPIPFRARVLRFGPEENGSRAELIVELPYDNISYENDQNRRLCKFHFSVLALVKTADGQIIYKASEDLPLQTALENGDELRQTTHYFDRTFTAPPGKYKLDVAVIDQSDRRLSTLTVPFELSPQPKGLALSQLTLVSKLEPLPQDGDPDDQLRYHGYRIVPEMPSENAARGSQLFFTVYPDPNSAAPPRVTIELRQNRSVLAESPLKLPETHAPGPIPVLASLANFSLPPGNFELWAKVTAGDVTREQKLDTTITGNTTFNRAPAETGSQLSALVEPKLLTGHVKPSDAEIARILDAGRQRAIDYKSALPNFSCRLVTRRSIKSGNSDWKTRDTMTQLLRYVDGHEDYKVLEVNGSPSSSAGELATQGVWSSGEFGAFLDTVFSPKAQAEFEWQGLTDVNGIQTNAFKYHITRRHSLYSVNVGHHGIAVAYHGFVYIDPNTLTVRRVSIEAENVPADFPVRESALTVDYNYFSIGGEQYLLPGSATLYIREAKRHLSKNEKQFRDYRRFAGQSSIKFN